MPLIPFGEWAPDLIDLDTGESPTILNVVPQADGYGPIKSLQGFTQALPGACRGYVFARNADGSITIFAATATNLYRLNNIDFSWINVSKSGGPYPGLAGGFNWHFIQFNSLVIAVQENVTPQVFDLTSSTAFADLGGAPPQASYVAVINRFIVLTGLAGLPYRIQWSGLNQPTTWDNVTAQSNFEDLADGGTLKGVAGNDQFGIVFQDSCIRNMIFAPGSPEIFDIVKIATNDGALNAGSIVTAGDKVYFVSPQGFKVIAPGGYPTPIAREKIDRTFFSDLDAANLQLLIGATDPTHTRVFWSYKSVAGAAGLFDSIICYDMVLNRFTKLSVSGEYLAALAKPGLTLEGLDPIAPGALAITGAANNGSGAIRITVASTSALASGQIRTISGVTGTTEANGTWAIMVIDATRFDLQGSAFVHAYASGGLVGGVLDQLPFSLDDVSVASLTQLSAVNAAHVVAFFSGAAMEATLETPEQDGAGRRMQIGALRPITDSPDAVCSVAARASLQTSSSYTAESALDTIGRCPQRVETRYARGRLRIPSGSSWSYARGIEPDFRPTGTR
ncbi:MAG: hypothetical protein JO000_21150 [Alphaproteobacteria bacterium]|nr:hypothetical protein [Alphaproteobacteria bacterium]